MLTVLAFIAAVVAIDAVLVVGLLHFSPPDDEGRFEQFFPYPVW